VSVVSSGVARTLEFDPGQFDYDGSVDARSLGLEGESARGVGYGGLRILARMNDPDHLDEVVSFRGASYFRLIGPGHVYGTSLRGIALNTAEPTPEEFPDFVRFWVEEPAPGDTVLVLHALLDGPSVTGAYRFELVAGRGPEVAAAREDTRPAWMSVRARLFARTEIPRLGVAPLTSMYLHGDVDPPASAWVRPRVHDAEMLVMETHAGEVIARPLSSPDRVRVTSLRDRDPRGFGLAQPRRSFDDFLDLEAEYHRRPGIWIEPLARWGEGGVLLAELPTTSEFADNVVAFWAPDDTLRAGDRIDFAWRVRTFDTGAPTRAEPLGRVVRSRIGGAGLPGQADPPPAHHRRIVVDFEGEGLRAVPEDAVVDPVLFASTGEVRDLRVERLPAGGRRATWILEGEPGVPADMRIFLRAPSGRTETWSYLLDLPAPAVPEAR
jgi:glucans biosynthesis protein